MGTIDPKFFRVALAQINLCVGDIEDNTRKILQYVAKAREKQADLVAFPELSVTGYPPEDLLLKSSFVNESLEALADVVRATDGIIAVVGFPHRARSRAGRPGTSLYNAAGVARDGRLLAVYKKILLPNYGVFDEKRYFNPGDEPLVFELDEFRFGVNICEDIWSPEVAKRQAELGSLVLFNISSSPYHVGKGASREEMLSARSRETKALTCYVNLVGGQDELVFDGESVVLSEDGKLIARAPQFEEALLVVDLDVAEAARKRNEYLTRTKLKKARPRVDDSGLVVKVRGRLHSRAGKVKPLAGRRPTGRARAAAAWKPLRPVIARRPNLVEEVYEALVLGTRDYVKKNGFKKVVVGLSGGVDSSLVAAIAVDALGPANVRGALLPSRYTTKQSVRDAEKLARNLGVKTLTISIEEIFMAYIDTLKTPFRAKKADVTEENIQARIRGNILMALSNKFGWLVLTTGNKSETAVGYSTLYGDTAGGFAVIKDVPKTLVYELAGFRNSVGRRVAIPKSVLTKAPTAELRPGQKDEDSLPPYSMLDPILEAYVERDKSRDEIKDEGFREDVVDRVIRMVDTSEYKRRQAPPGVKITPKAFGKDRRMPITNLYRVRKS
jgi:NAD+ synthase (glutamine-hydrolysing)